MLQSGGCQAGCFRPLSQCLSALPPCLARLGACLNGRVTRVPCACAAALNRELRLKTGELASSVGQHADFSARARGLGPEGVALLPAPGQGRHPNGVAAQRGLGLFAGVGARGVAHIQFFASAPTPCGREELYLRIACATSPSPRGVALMQLQALMQLLAQFGCLRAGDAWLLPCWCFRHLHHSDALPG